MIVGTYSSVLINFSAHEQEINTLRRKAWEVTPGFKPEAFPDYWLDDCDRTATHWGVFDNGKLIASARLGIYYSLEDVPYLKHMEMHRSHLKLPLASLNRLVVDPAYRGNGLSHLLDKVRVEAAEKSNAKCAVGQAVTTRIASLKSLGFTHYGKLMSIEELPDIELNMMIKYL